MIDDGRIVKLGADVEIPKGSQRIDVSGSTITPGFIGAWTQLGLVEISGVAGSNDGQSGRADVTASYRAVDSYNPDSSVIPIQRAHGVTTALVAPSGAVISGTAAVFDLAGARPVVEDAGLVVRLGGQAGGARGAVFAWLRGVFNDSLAFISNRKFFERNQMRTLVSRLDLEAIAPVAQANALPRARGPAPTSCCSSLGENREFGPCFSRSERGGLMRSSLRPTILASFSIQPPTIGWV